MADSGNTHFWIPSENIKVAKITPTGGGKSYVRYNQVTHGQKLEAQLKSLGQLVVAKPDSSLTKDYIIQIKTPKETSAKEQRLKLGGLGFDIVSYSRHSENSATARIPKSKFESLYGKIERYTNEPAHPGKTYLDVMEELTDVPIEEKLDPVFLKETNKTYNCVISVYNILSKIEKNAILDKILLTISENGIKGAEKIVYLSGNIVVSAILPIRLIRQLGNSFQTVRSISENVFAETVIVNSVRTDPLMTPLNVGPPSTNSIVAVVDSGIVQNSKALNNLIVATRTFHPQGSVGVNVDHGTFVASRIIYGESLETPSHWLQPHCKVVDIQVFGNIPNPKTGIPEQQGLADATLAKVMDTVVKEFYQTVKVFNLSFGMDPIRKDHFSTLASELDFLSREFGVLFINSSGNIRRTFWNFPDHFKSPVAVVTTPGESLLSITVGSYAKFTIPGAFAKENELSPFSCIGPGSDGGIKPELVAHGGNMAKPYSTTPRIGTYGLFSDGQHIGYDVGTSFAAPLVSQYAARLFSNYEAPTPNLIKALLCHFTEPVQFPEVGIDGTTMVGFGKPNIEDALFSATTSATYLFQGSIQNNTYQTIKFHVPKCLASGASKHKLRIKITLVYNPPVNMDNHVEYSCSRISMLVQKATSSGLKDINIGAWNKNFNLAWNPILHCENQFSREYASGEWTVRLRLYIRGKLKEDFKQDFAIIVQVYDGKGSAEVYKEIHDSFAHLYKTIKLKKAA